ncbi:hypothetical protein DN752_17595 [Echinicola strongylocentroti]|uniref:DUF5683 domain-containing protein n=1 Tax=Echinicola strongylocentroti TaxID=1795355 RepID=A0A2Z4IQY5_9BACT|nr:hypothetical protein DN752_17595 [Echinicola strongylocentroti]
MFQHPGVGQDIRTVHSDSTGQAEITIDQKDIKNPKKAALLSAILPGAGQVYNEKMWKVPIIYGGIITTAYFVEFNNRRYQLFKEALTIYRDDDESTDNIFPNLNEDGLIRNVDYWRRNRDACYLVFTAIYALNIVDALVDAHLSGFDVSNDLTFKLEPSVEPTYASGNAVGLSFKIQFK